MPHIFRPERPPISGSKDEAIAEILKHSEAAWSEHRAVDSTKMGLHYELPSWLSAAAENFYQALESPYVLPPEFFTLAGNNPEVTDMLRQYYADTCATWSAIERSITFGSDSQETPGFLRPSEPELTTGTSA
jgi:hypothetical protein